MNEAFVRFWGVRGSYPAPFESHLQTGGNTSCVEVRVGDRVVICDAGTGIIPLGQSLMAQSEVRELSLILTHFHWDHISGLPFFLPAFSSDWTINVFAPGGSKGEVERHISEQMRAPYFPVETENWLATINYLEPNNGTLNFGPIEVNPFNVHHPGSTYGYRIDARGKSVVYASDNELSFIAGSIDRRRNEFQADERVLLEQMKNEERQRAIDFMHGVDVLIHDSQYTPEDYQDKRGWGHSCYVDTVTSAIDAQVRNLYLFHLDPNYDDVQVERIRRHALEIVAERGSGMACHIAREGTVVPL